MLLQNIKQLFSAAKIQQIHQTNCLFNHFFIMNEILDYDKEDDLPVLEQISVMPTVQKYALYMIFASIIPMLFLLFEPSLMQNNWLKLLGIVITCVIFYFCFKEHKSLYLKGFLPFSRIFKLSLYICLFSAIVLAIWNFVFYKFIAPNMLDLLLEIAQKAIEEKMPDNPEQVDMTMNMYRKWVFTPSTMAVVIFFTGLFMNGVLGIIVGLFQRKELQ